MCTLLIVDDEPGARYALRRVFDSTHKVLEAACVADARTKIRDHDPDLVLLDYSMPGEDGMALLSELHESPDPPAVIMITAQGSERVAVAAMKSGAYDYLTKPFDLDELRLSVSRALERQELKREVRGLRRRLEVEGHFGAMVGLSQPMRDLFETASRVAQTSLPVLLTGETGTGKDVLAREIHNCSDRSRRPFVALNCAALPETLVETELFGCEKGAYTGATASRAGKFELADRGTLFLDEIGDMPLATQAKILRAAESGSIERVGGSRPIEVDVRLIAATNKDVAREIQEGRFREDLYFRLGAVVLHLPPLRERGEDMQLLLQHFWAGLEAKYGRTGPELTSEAIDRLASAPWPGNVRELRYTAERIFVLCTADKVTRSAVEPFLKSAHPQSGNELEPALTANDYREARRLFDAAYIARKLNENGGNVTRTAAAIGIERQSLQEKLKKLRG